MARGPRVLALLVSTGMASACIAAIANAPTAAPAEASRPAVKDVEPKIDNLKRLARQHFYEAHFVREQETRREIIALMKAQHGLMYPGIATQESYIKSIEHALTLSEKDLKQIARARLDVKQADELLFRDFKPDSTCIDKFKAALDVHTRLLGPEDSVVAELQYRLGGALQRCGRNEQAIPTLQKAAQSKARTQNEVEAFGPTNALCLALLASGHYEEAEKASLEAARLVVLGWGNTSHDYPVTLFNVAVAQRHLTKFDEAEKMYLRAEQLFARIGGRDAVFAIQCRFGRAQCLAGLGQTDEAVALFEQALKDAQHIPPSLVPGFTLSLPDVYMEYADTLLAAGKRMKAEQAQEYARELRRSLILIQE